MPLKPPLPPLARWLFAGAAVLLAISVADAALHDVLAQNPFGAPRPAQAAQPEASGIIGWLLAKQSEFYRQMSSTIRAAKSDGSAVWTLLFISFAYGIFHAAGPGHGKAVIASYLVANRETARRGIALSFASALMQSLVAILIVGISARVLNATAKTMCKAEGVIEIASYALIALFGLRLVWLKGRTFIRALQAAQPVPAIAGVPHHHDHHHHHDAHDHHDHGHDHHHDHGHAHAHAHHGHDHVHDEHCGHSHGPTPSELSGPGGWQRGFAAILTVGIRPCSGAILVLVFALAQGLFWAGIAATFLMGLGTAITVAAIAVVAVSAKDIAARLSAGRDGGGALFMRGIEFAAAGVVLLFGAGLLFGYIAAERTMCF
ncbi:nickel transporter [Bradyrhizobium sp. WBOS7]|uniref:Nickel/cobalt efflux system n=1 Tax=Bradyrhizobium betae TaxID=244734 RepID=A0AAE9SPC4_9BRAD|nr:nickel transporter [Bradyrhizobium sp. WBOS2]MDD1570717.1 nickel transporter [Bradyrhizobium sp. WBOS1]MDD1578475.1 nickel transporter [Bradyrhizobium sp. WBOS7]MDD1601198.1 nickel transporter [Bradyrhizobium sp. WBOS16]UUO34837.1 nickel transporter [Bradyrhizobium sp. WBOS01]UUO41165.1 nickel transporter [Bradyrhizobium sp. WBOS02]UUO55483.1 nickel transporter [Bradyrhizobium sp. WBOS07]UUO65535.1 nickel transporter [Bradyrhizobium betae]